MKEKLKPSLSNNDEDDNKKQNNQFPICFCRDNTKNRKKLNFLYIWKNKETANSNCHIDRDVCQINKTGSSAISLISMEIIKKPLMHV